jgi:hypothetical protein
VQHKVTADYSIWLRKGTLYPQGTVVGPDRKVVPMKIFSWASMTLKDEITYAGGDVESGEYSVDLRIRAGDLWSKDYPVVAPRALKKDQYSIEATFPIPFPKILSDIAKIEKEIGMSSPTGKYELDVVLNTKVAIAGTDNLSTDYAPAFTFTMGTSGLVLEAPKELAFTEKRTDDQQVEKTNTRFFLGQTRTVDEAKQVATAGLGASGVLLVAALGWSVSIGRAAIAGPARRYRDRLVRVVEVGSARVDLSVRVSGIKELARIADEAQVAIMELESGTASMPPEFDRQPSPELQGRKYFVVAGNTLYYAV